MKLQILTLNIENNGSFNPRPHQVRIMGPAENFGTVIGSFGRELHPGYGLTVAVLRLGETREMLHRRVENTIHTSRLHRHTVNEKIRLSWEQNFCFRLCLYFFLL